MTEVAKSFTSVRVYVPRLRYTGMTRAIHDGARIQSPDEAGHDFVAQLRDYISKVESLADRQLDRTESFEAGRRAQETKGNARRPAKKAGA